jgi:hypothetical protein
MNVIPESLWYFGRLRNVTVTKKKVNFEYVFMAYFIKCTNEFMSLQINFIQKGNISLFPGAGHI